MAKQQRKQVISMNLSQIEKALTEIYERPHESGESRHIVFWVDKDQEFTEDIESLDLANVKIHTLHERNQFYTKYLLEQKDINSSYLIYTTEEMAVEDNWLADTVLYSKTFYADRLSLLLEELNIHHSLRAVVKKYERFFNSSERRRKFSAFGLAPYTEAKIELAILSTLSAVKTADFDGILRKVLMENLDVEENKYMIELKKYKIESFFWKAVHDKYGYEREKPTLKTLFMHLALTALSQSMDEKYLESVESFIANRNCADALVFVDHWMHHSKDSMIFDEYAVMVEEEVNLAGILQSISVEKFKEADVFPFIDRAIILYISNGLLDQLEEYDRYKKLIRLRRSKHHYDKYQNVYEALYCTVEMHAFHKEHKQGLPQGAAIDLYKAYAEKFYVMDTYYRKFYVAYDLGEASDLLKKIKVLVENLYTSWYMGQLSSHWSQAVQTDMKDKWLLPGVTSQQNFYSTFVRPRVREGERIFVVISDAMRYEVGVELKEKLITETFGTCEIEPLLGVVPSVTKLGMASLLPYRTLDIKEDGRVFVDERDTSGIQNRKQIIEREVEDSIAVHFQDFMNTTDSEALFRGKKLVYIYHNTIDAFGDNAATEINTFAGVEQTLDELLKIVNFIRNRLSGSNIYLTADHGFLYQRDALEESDKIQKEQMNTIDVKRRYMLSKEKRDVSGQLAIDLSAVIKNEEQLTAYVPNATIRYKIQGSGVNFVHGGASLQEIVVPLLTFKNKRLGQKGSQAITKVDVKLTSTTRRITNRIFHLDFFQMEKVGDKTAPRTVVIHMADSEGQVLSNEETIIADRANDDSTERTFRIRFVLKTITYDRDKKYYLVMKDVETGAVTEKTEFTISLAHASDFDF